MNVLVDIALQQPDLFREVVQEFRSDGVGDRAGIVALPRFVWQEWTLGADEPDDAFVQRESRGNLGWWVTAIEVMSERNATLAVLPDDDSPEVNISIVRSVPAAGASVLTRKVLPVDDERRGGEPIAGSLFTAIGRLRERGRPQAVEACALSNTGACVRSGPCDKRCRKYSRSIGRGDELHCLCV
jgi:hypothetical protein